MSTATDDFNLRSLVADHLERSNDPNPHHVVDAVIADVPDEYLRPALATCLPSLVVAMVGHRRRVQRQTEDAPNPVRGRKAAVAAYRGILATRLPVNGEWKFLGACTKEDLLAAADARQALAEANEAWAKRYRRLAQSMSSKQTVADLPLDLVEGMLQ